MNLIEAYFEQMQKIVDGFECDWVSFKSSDFPPTSSEIDDSFLIVKVGEKGYHPSPDKIDWLIFHAPSESYKAIGMLLVSSVFSHQKTRISLHNPSSEISLITVEPCDDKLLSGRYKVQPISFEYFPTILDGHFLEDIPSEVPSLFLVLKDEEGFIKAEEYKNRDTIFITGSNESLLFLAQVFFDIGNKEQPTNEFNLERPYAFGGVGNLSAEVKFYTERNEDFLGKII